MLCLPAAILLSVSKLVFSWQWLGLAGIAWGNALFAALLLCLLRKRYRWKRDEFAVLLLCAALGNTGYLGFAVTQALWGENARALAVVFDQFGTVAILSVFGLILCVRASAGQEKNVSPLYTLRRMLGFPPTLAMLVGLLLPQGELNRFDGLVQTLHLLADAMLPLVMLATGFAFRLHLPEPRQMTALVIGLSLKLLLLPAAAWGMARGLGFKDDFFRVGVLEAAMPPMATAAVLACRYQLAPQLAYGLIGYGLLLSFVTLPLWTRCL
jgi:predicted permease